MVSVSKIRAIGHRADRTKIGQELFRSLEASTVNGGRRERDPTPTQRFPERETESILQKGVVRRRLTENDGEVALRVLESIKIVQPVAKARRRKPNPDWASPQHIRVIQEYAAGKHVTEIVREEKSSRGTIIRISRTAPFRVAELCGIIKPES